MCLHGAVAEGTKSKRKENNTGFSPQSVPWRLPETCFSADLPPASQYFPSYFYHFSHFLCPVLFFSVLHRAYCGSNVWFSVYPVHWGGCIWKKLSQTQNVVCKKLTKTGFITYYCAKLREHILRFSQTAVVRCKFWRNRTLYCVKHCYSSLFYICILSNMYYKENRRMENILVDGLVPVQTLALVHAESRVNTHHIYLHSV